MKEGCIDLYSKTLRTPRAILQRDAVPVTTLEGTAPEKPSEPVQSMEEPVRKRKSQSEPDIRLPTGHDGPIGKIREQIYQDLAHNFQSIYMHRGWKRKLGLRVDP